MTVFGDFRKEYTEEFVKATGNDKFEVRFWNQSFQKLCLASRQQRKPVILMVQKDATPEAFAASVSFFEGIES